MESAPGTSVLTVAFIVLIVATNAFSAQSTSAQIIYPGIYVDFTCKVSGPFIQVNDHEITERGIGGYVADLLDMGIEAKNVTIISMTRFSLNFIPTVCVNGSSPQLGNRSTTTITMTCQNLTGQFVTIRHFIFTLKYQSRLPAPANVSMSDTDNMLEWSRPPCVTNSSSDTYSIEVNHTLEFTYTIYITVDGTTTTITVSVTSYNLSDMLQPCSEYTIEVCACNSETVPCGDNERSPPITFTMPDCPVNPNPSVSEDTVSTISPPATEQEDGPGTKQTTGISGSSLIVFIVAGGIVMISLVVFCVLIIVSVLVYNHMKTQKKNNNNTAGGRVSTQPASVYDEEVFEPQCSVEMKENVAYGPINKTK